MRGWRRSADRTCLHANSLLTGNFTGNFQFRGTKGQFLCEKLLCRSSFSYTSLLNLTGKKFARTGNFLAETGKFASKDHRVKFSVHTHGTVSGGRNGQRGCGVGIEARDREGPEPARA
jgi:hypothetical protein